MSQHQYFFFLFALGFNTARLGIWTLPPFHSDETRLWVCIMKCANKASCADCITVGCGKGCWEGTWLRPWEQASKNWQGTFRMCPGGRTPSLRKRLPLEHRHSLKPSPVCTWKYQSHVQGFHISSGSHSALHTEEGISAVKQWNTSFPVLPNIPVLIKSRDKHNIGCFLSL